MEFDWVVGWVGLWVQSFHFAMGWVGLGQSFDGLGWVEEIGPVDDSDWETLAPAWCDFLQRSLRFFQSTPVPSVSHLQFPVLSSSVCLFSSYYLQRTILQAVLLALWPISVEHVRYSVVFARHRGHCSR